MTDKQIIIDDQKKTIHRLQDECTEKTNAIIALGEQLKRSEQECEKLKETFDGLFKVQYKLADNNKKLRQCLTEIKEIAERDKEFCIKCNGNKEIDCVDCIEGGRALLAKDILQKISECEGNDE
jgi:predicted nuclease with TOPRIM domain